MNIIVALHIINQLAIGINSTMQAIKDIRSQAECTSESKEMMNARIDKIQKEVEDYFKDLK